MRDKSKLQSISSAMDVQKTLFALAVTEEVTMPFVNECHQLAQREVNTVIVHLLVNSQ